MGNYIEKVSNKIADAVSMACALISEDLKGGRIRDDLQNKYQGRYNVEIIVSRPDGTEERKRFIIRGLKNDRIR